MFWFGCFVVVVAELWSTLWVHSSGTETGSPGDVTQISLFFWFRTKSTCAVVPLCLVVRPLARRSSCAGETSFLAGKRRKLAAEKATSAEVKREVETSARLLVQEVVYLYGIQLKSKKSFEVTEEKEKLSKRLQRKSYNDVSVEGLRLLKGRHRKNLLYFVESSIES